MIVMVMDKYDDDDDDNDGKINLHHHINFYHHHHHHHNYRGLKNLVFPASDRLKLHEQKSFFHTRFPSSIASYPLVQRGDDRDGDHAVNYAVMATGVEEVMMNGSCSGDRGDDDCGNSHRTTAAIDLDTVTVVSNFFRSEKYQRNRR